MKVSITIKSPGKLFDLAKWEAEMKAGMDELCQETQKDFEATTSEWDEHDPKFLITKAHKEGNAIKASVWTDDLLYTGLNNGMPAHDITATGEPSISHQYKYGLAAGIPSSNSTLVFQSNYHPKTIPMSIGSGRSQSSGQWIRKVSVSHPGTEPRKWDEAIAAKHKDDLAPIAVKAIEVATK